MFLQKKTIFAVVILFFAAVTLLIQVGKEFRSSGVLTLQEGVNVICTHATVRCPTCLTIERLTQEVLSEHFSQTSIAFHSLNYEQRQFDGVAEQFKIATATVLLVNVKESLIVDGKTLTNETWKYYTDSAAFKAMLKEQLDAFLQGKPMEEIDPTETFVFEGEEESLSALSDTELDRYFGVEEDIIGKMPDQYVWIVYFHRLPECELCHEMSQHLRELLTKRFLDDVRRQRIMFRYRNFEDDSNAALVQKLKIASPALAVMLVKNGKPLKAKLARRIWSLTAEKQELFDYLGEIIQEYLGE